MKLQQASTTWGICLAIGLRLIFLLDPRSRWPIGKEILKSCRVCNSRAPPSSSARLSTEIAPCGETQTLKMAEPWGRGGVLLRTFLKIASRSQQETCSYTPPTRSVQQPLPSEDTGLDPPAPHPRHFTKGPRLKPGRSNSLYAHGE